MNAAPPADKTENHYVSHNRSLLPRPTAYHSKSHRHGLSSSSSSPPSSSHDSRLCTFSLLISSTSEREKNVFISPTLFSSWWCVFSFAWRHLLGQLEDLHRHSTPLRSLGRGAVSRLASGEFSKRPPRREATDYLILSDCKTSFTIPDFSPSD